MHPRQTNPQHFEHASTALPGTGQIADCGLAHALQSGQPNQKPGIPTWDIRLLGIFAFWDTRPLLFTFRDIHLLGYSPPGIFTFWDVHLPGYSPLGYSPSGMFTFCNIHLLGYSPSGYSPSGYPPSGIFTFRDIHLPGHAPSGTCAFLDTQALACSPSRVLTLGHRRLGYSLSGIFASGIFKLQAFPIGHSGQH